MHALVGSLPPPHRVSPPADDDHVAGYEETSQYTLITSSPAVSVSMSCA
jgi:hypothetical protein